MTSATRKRKHLNKSPSLKTISLIDDEENEKGVICISFLFSEYRPLMPKYLRGTNFRGYYILQLQFFVFGLLSFAKIAKFAKFAKISTREN